MALSHFPNALTVSAITLAAASLGACSAQSYGHSGSYAGANCNTAVSSACGGRYGQSHGGYNHAFNGAQGHGEYSAASYGAQSARKTRYGTSYQSAGYSEQYYAQPQMMLRPAPQLPPSYNYQTASTSYKLPSLGVEMYNQTVETANCPAGTTAQSDGTCLQGGSISSYTSSYSAPTYFTPTTPTYSSGYVTSGDVQNCPAGTTPQSDGTCLEGSSISSYSSSTYSGPSYSTSSSSSVAPPVSSYDFSDYNWGSKDTTWGSDSYVSPGSRVVDSPNNYPSTSTEPNYSFMPYRK